MQEMMGLSLFMLDQSRKDSEVCLETAFNTYLVQKLYPSLTIVLNFIIFFFVNKL